MTKRQRETVERQRGRDRQWKDKEAETDRQTGSGETKRQRQTDRQWSDKEAETDRQCRDG